MVFKVEIVLIEVVYTCLFPKTEVVNEHPDFYSRGVFI